MNHAASVRTAVEAAKRIHLTVVKDIGYYFIDTPTENGLRSITVGFNTKRAQPSVDVCLFDGRDEISAFKATTVESAVLEYTRLCENENVVADLRIGYVLGRYFASLENSTVN